MIDSLVQQDWKGYHQVEMSSTGPVTRSQSGSFDATKAIIIPDQGGTVDSEESKKNEVGAAKPKVVESQHMKMEGDAVDMRLFMQSMMQTQQVMMSQLLEHRNTHVSHASPTGGQAAEEWEDE